MHFVFESIIVIRVRIRTCCDVAAVDRRPHSVSAADVVIGRIAAGGITDDQIAYGVDIQTTIVRCDVVAFDAIRAKVGRVNTGTVADSFSVARAIVVENGCCAVDLNSVASVRGRGAIADKTTRAQEITIIGVIKCCATDERIAGVCKVAAACVAARCAGCERAGGAYFDSVAGV